jgi:hypothetical protein
VIWSNVRKEYLEGHAMSCGFSPSELRFAIRHEDDPSTDEYEGNTVILTHQFARHGSRERQGDAQMSDDGGNRGGGTFVPCGSSPFSWYYPLPRGCCATLSP